MGQNKSTIYDKNYYICKALTQNKRFLAETAEIKNYYRRKGHPIKEGGFSYPFEFQEWYKALSKEAEAKQIENYRILFGETLTKFIGRSDLNDRHYKFMFDFVFFPKKKMAEYTPQLWEAKVIFQIPEPKYIKYLIEEGFYLRLFPHTRLDDIKKDWRKIQGIASRATKDHPDKLQWHKSRSHEDKDFPLALKIVENYAKMKSETEAKMERERSHRGTTIYEKIKRKMPKKYKNTSPKKIKKLLHKYRYLAFLFKEPAYQEP